MEDTNKKILESEEIQQAINLKDSAMHRLNVSFLKHIHFKEYKISNNLAYWIKLFSKYHDEERCFDFSKIKTYSRGDVVKVNLGFNIGNEMGGLHYCIVLSKNDNHSFGTLNVVPLTSVKDGKVYPKYSVGLGNELYQLLNQKYTSLLTRLECKIKNDSFTNIDLFLEELCYLEKIKNEIEIMKSESVALINQITTISKQRIYDPINNFGALSKIRLSSASLDKIDVEIKRMLTK